MAAISGCLKNMVGHCVLNKGGYFFDYFFNGIILLLCHLDWRLNYRLTTVSVFLLDLKSNIVSIVYRDVVEVVNGAFVEVYFFNYFGTNICKAS